MPWAGVVAVVRGPWFVERESDRTRMGAPGAQAQGLALGAGPCAFPPRARARSQPLRPRDAHRMLRSRARANPSPRQARPAQPLPCLRVRGPCLELVSVSCGSGRVVVSSPVSPEHILHGWRNRLSAHTDPISSIVIHSRDGQPAREAVHHTIHYAFISFDKSVPRRLGTGTVTISTESAASVRTDRLIASPPPLPRPSTSLGLISQHEAPRASGAFHLPPRNTSRPIPSRTRTRTTNAIHI